MYFGSRVSVKSNATCVTSVAFVLSECSWKCCWSPVINSLSLLHVRLWRSRALTINPCRQEARPRYGKENLEEITLFLVQVVCTLWNWLVQMSQKNVGEY